MIVKKKICTLCKKETFIWKNDKGDRYCKICWMKQNPVFIKPVKYIIPKKSSKKIIDDLAYSKLRKIFFSKEENQLCSVRLTDICTGQATDIHHKCGRGIYYLDIITWIPVCRHCHNFIENNPTRAKELGFSSSRLEINN